MERQNRPSAKADTARTGETMAPTQILVVEDESVVALDIQSRLISLGYAVPAVAAYGEDAIREAGENNPDLVMMDIQLKGEMDGVEAAEQIRSRFDIPVVYLTAYADGATLERAKVAEAFGYLLKPFKERELQTTIEMALYKHKMERRLKESERWLSATLRSIGDAVIATDAHGDIQFLNPLAERLTGWKQNEAKGQDLSHVFNIIDGATRQPGESLFSRVLQEGAAIQLEDNTLLIAKDGSEVPVEDSAAPIKDDEGEIVGVVIVFRDVTERMQAQEALSLHATELQARNEELDAFAHTVAHDLKNPVNLIVGFSEVLRTDYATMEDEELQHYLQIVARSGLKISSIIDELLLLAGVRQMDVELEPLDMASIVAEAQERLGHMVEIHQTEITLPSHWPLAMGYAPWVEEVWVNYLSNGIKYGGQPPHLTLGAKELPDGTICFWIRDNGPGLSPEDQARLFTPFTQLNKIRANGHGLGLSIVQRIVNKLDGRVGVVSQVGRGSIFTFTLPRAEN
jgi:PAS domain S-box-containing protein